MSDSLLQYALFYLERKHWSVIPVGRDKKPLLQGWTKYQAELPTRDDVMGWWKQWPNANIGIATGAASNLVVVDVDEAEGMVLAKSLPATLTAQTGKGGYHLFFQRGEERVPNAVRVRPGIDVRADGGQVVVAPSIHPNGNEYRWINQLPVAPLPDAVRQWFSNKADTKEDEIWTASFGSGQRNMELTRRIGKLASLGMSVVDVLLIAQVWNQHHCNPPLAKEEVARTVDSVVKKQADKPKFDVVTTSELIDRYCQDDTVWTIDDWLPAQTLGLVVAPPETFKTWLLLDLAVSVATGKPFLGQYAVNGPGPVLFIQQEDPFPLLVSRLSTILNLGEIEQVGDEYSFKDPHAMLDMPIYWHPSRVLHVDNKDAIAGLQQVVSQIKPVLVIIDPLYSVIRADDFGASGAQDMLAFKRMRDEYKCSFMIAHHTKKAMGQTRERDNLWGSQFLNAWLETGWQVRPHDGESEVLIHRHYKIGAQTKPKIVRFDIAGGLFEVHIQDIEDAEDVDVSLKIVAELRKGDVRSMRQVKDRLGMSGMGSISRAFKKLGVIKGADGVYVLPKEMAGIT